MMLLLAALGVAATVGAALVIAATVALGRFFWVPYLLAYLALWVSGLGTRHRPFP